MKTSLKDELWLLAFSSEYVGGVGEGRNKFQSSFHPEEDKYGFL